MTKQHPFIIWLDPNEFMDLCNWFEPVERVSSQQIADTGFDNLYLDWPRASIVAALKPNLFEEGEPI